MEWLECLILIPSKLASWMGEGGLHWWKLKILHFILIWLSKILENPSHMHQPPRYLNMPAVSALFKISRYIIYRTVPTVDVDIPYKIKSSCFFLNPYELFLITLKFSQLQLFYHIQYERFYVFSLFSYYFAEIYKVRIQ